jgi:hypothetical protein
MNNVVVTMALACLMLVSGTAQAENVLTNPGFETGDTTGWTTWGCTLSVSTEQARKGNCSVLVTSRSQNWQGPVQNIINKLNIGQSYFVSAWVKLKDQPSDDGQLTIAQKDGSGTKYFTVDTQEIYNNKWVLLSGEFTLNVTGTLTSLNFYIQTQNSTVDFYVDDVSINKKDIYSEPLEWTAAPLLLSTDDNLETGKKNIVVESDDFKLVFSLFYNGGPHRLFDKSYDATDNLNTGPWYCQGGIFDYDAYLGDKREFSTTQGKNNSISRTSLEILEKTGCRVRIRQKCHPRLNAGNGPKGDPFVELDMVHCTTEWTIYPTGRVNIKFDAVVPPEFNGISSSGPGGEGKGITTDGTRKVIGINGTSFRDPWVTKCDTLESTSGGWGPIEIAEKPDDHTLILESPAPAGENLDFTIRRENLTKETISIHSDGDTGRDYRAPKWEGGRNRGPISQTYVMAHWTKPPRKFGSSLSFFEPYEATFLTVDLGTWRDISFTQVGIAGKMPFKPHHRHLMAQLGTEKGQALPRIKSMADAEPSARDYRHPYSEARIGSLLSGEEYINGYNIRTGAYSINAEDNIAAIAFDASRGEDYALAYYMPAVLINDFDVDHDYIKIEISRDNGKSFSMLGSGLYNITTLPEESELGTNKRLFQYLGTIPATATDSSGYVFRFSTLGECFEAGTADCVKFSDLKFWGKQWFKFPGK